MYTCILYVVYNTHTINSFVTKMNLKRIMLSKVSQTQTDTIFSYLYVDSKKVRFIKIESRIVAARG